MKLLGLMLLMVGGLMLGSFIFDGLFIGAAFIRAGLAIITDHFIPIVAVALVVIGFILIKK